MPVPSGLVQVYQFRPNYEPLWELDDNYEQDFTCPGDGLYPDPSSGCSSFYRCEKDQVKLEILSSNSYFFLLFYSPGDSAVYLD